MSSATVALAFCLLMGGAMTAELKRAFQSEQIVPDIIDQCPASILEVRYGSERVRLGRELTPRQVKDVPTVIMPEKEGMLYTVLMTDPDAPSRQNPKFREWHHWLVGNVPAGGNPATEGDTLSEYVGAGPPKGTGLHRYVVLCFLQPSHIPFAERHLTNRSGANRGKFSTRDFARKYGLEAVAGNFFLAKWDEYVPTLYKQLGD